MERPTVFQVLIAERRLREYEVFKRHYETTAELLADRQGPASLRTSTIGRRQFMRWAHGQLEGVPRSEARRILEYMFQIPVEQLFNTAEPATGEAAEPARDSAAPGPPPGAFTQNHGEDVVMSAAREAANFAARAEQTNVGPHTLEQLEADIRRIATTYPNRPVEPFFLEARELRNRTFELLEGKQPPQYTTELYLAAGFLCGILANASFDLGRYAAAETQARAGFLCGELAGHNGLRAWLRGLQALMAYWDGRPYDAIRLAESGREFRPENGTADIRLASIAARAYGQTGHSAEALASLRLAEELRDRDVGEDSPGGMMAFPLPKQLYCASSTYLWLGGTEALDRAERHAQQAVELFEGDPPEQRRVGELSLARMDLALARLGRGELEGAAEQVNIVLGIVSHRRIESVGRSLEHFARHLAADAVSSSRTAIGLRDAIASHRARQPAALPPGAGC
jgi:tetratricopeptide (TPR) repeat protein